MMPQLFSKLKRMIEFNKFSIDRDKFKIFFIFEANNHTITLVDGLTAQLLIDGVQAPLTPAERKAVMGLIFDAHNAHNDKSGQSMDKSINEFLK